jgi:hypothetical protein
MPGHAFRPFGGDQVAVIASEDHRDDARCFADEVVVDFPSVAPAVDRMRRAFLAQDDAATLRTAVQISWRAACDGVTLPLEVPVRCICARCGGRGETWTESCLACRGLGIAMLRHELQVTVPSGVLDGARFHFTVTPRHHPPTRIELRVFIDPATVA